MPSSPTSSQATGSSTPVAAGRGSRQHFSHEKSSLGVRHVEQRFADETRRDWLHEHDALRGLGEEIVTLAVAHAGDHRQRPLLRVLFGHRAGFDQFAMDVENANGAVDELLEAMPAGVDGTVVLEPDQDSGECAAAERKMATRA